MRIAANDKLRRLWEEAVLRTRHSVYPESGPQSMYEGVSKSFRTYHLERELQMIQLSATRCSCIAIL
jgi:hypothetical protein